MTSTLSLNSTYINDTLEALAYRLDKPEHDSVNELLSLYNPLSGPIRKLVTYYGAAGGFPVHVGHTEYYDIDHVLQRLTGMTSLNTGLHRSLFAGGKGWDLHDMFISSLGETVERLLGALHFLVASEDYVFGTFRELGRQGIRALPPEDLPLFSAEQYADPDFQYEPFTEDTPLAWVMGQRMFSGDAVAVPAQFVEIFYPPRPDEAMIGYSVSGGLSNHIDKTHAVFHGITEVIERDAVNVHWYANIPPARIVIDRPIKSLALQRILDHVESMPGEITLYHHMIDMPEVPVITAIQQADWLTQYSYYAGGGADNDIEMALLKALNEFAQSERTIKVAQFAPERLFATGARQFFDMGPDDPIESITLFFKVISYYGHATNFRKLDWYLNDGPEIPLSELPISEATTASDRLHEIASALQGRGIDPILFDVTPAPMKHTKIMKTFIPEYTQPFIMSKPMLAHPRFRDAPVILGLRDTPLQTADLNPDPLPYP